MLPYWGKQHDSDLFWEMRKFKASFALQRPTRIPFEVI